MKSRAALRKLYREVLTLRAEVVAAQLEKLNPQHAAAIGESDAR